MAGYYGTSAGTASYADTVWQNWGYATSGTTNNVTTAGTDTIWATWSPYAGGTTATYVCNDNAWKVWVQTPASSFTPVTVWTPVITPETEEQRKVRLAREAEIREAYDREQKRILEENKLREEKRKKAAARAKALLRVHLTEDQKKMLEEKKYFYVDLPNGTKYRIDQGRSRNVRKVDEAGKVIKTYCAHHADYEIPDEDHMLTQLLMLRFDEAAFLSVANVS